MAQGHACATRMLLCELINEVCVDAAERAKLERIHVARRQLHLLLLLRAISERRTGGRPRRRKRRMRVCAWNVCNCANAVRSSRLRTSTARTTFLDLFSISFRLSSSTSPLSSEESGIVLPHVVMCHLYLRHDEGYDEFGTLRTRDLERR